MGSSSSGSKSGFSLGGSVRKIFVLTCGQKQFGLCFDYRSPRKRRLFLLKTNTLILKIGGHHMNADHVGDLRVDRLHQNTSVSGHIIHEFSESGPFGLFTL